MEAEKIKSLPTGFFWSGFPIHGGIGLTRFVVSSQASSRSPGVTSLGLFTSLGSHAQLEYRLVAQYQPEEPGAASSVGAVDRTGSLWKETWQANTGIRISIGRLDSQFS